MFIDENLRNRMATADSTSQFLAAQLEDTRKKLEEIEKERAQFRQQYMGELPEQVTPTWPSSAPPRCVRRA